MSATLTIADMLLAAILAEPDDNGLRLIYADWLDDNGDEAGRAHATFIREQIRVSNSLSVTRGGRAFVFYLPDSQVETADPGVIKCPDWAEWVRIRRGFIEGVQCELQAWLDHGADFVRAHPITRVALADVCAVQRARLAIISRRASKVTSTRWGVAIATDKTWPLRDVGWHPTREAAEKALSDVLLEHARS